LSHNNTDNGQTRLISGQMPKFKCCTTEMLIKAKNNLSEYFTVCGLTEKFDESYLLVQKALNLPFIFYTNKNITSSNKKNLKISESEIETITKHNELDLELYDYATHLLDEQINKLGSAFQDELDEFKLGNHKYQQKMKKIQFVSNLPSRAFNFIRSF